MDCLRRLKTDLERIRKLMGASCNKIDDVHTKATTSMGGGGGIVDRWHRWELCNEAEPRGGPKRHATGAQIKECQIPLACHAMNGQPQEVALETSAQLGILLGDRRDAKRNMSCSLLRKGPRNNAQGSGHSFSHDKEIAEVLATAIVFCGQRQKDTYGYLCF